MKIRVEMNLSGMYCRESGDELVCRLRQRVRAVGCQGRGLS